MKNCRFVTALALTAWVLVGCSSTPGSESTSLVIDAGDFQEMPQVAMRGIRKDGPEVLIKSPANGTVFTENDQIMVEVVFNPSNRGQPADMSSLDVVVKKGWFGKNITDDLIDHLEDNRLFAESVSMSGYTGSFKFEISIKDMAGQLTEEVFEIEIED